MTNYEFRITNEVVAPTTHGGEVSSFKFQVFSFQQRIEDEDENEDEDEEQMAARMLAGGSTCCGLGQSALRADGVDGVIGLRVAMARQARPTKVQGFRRE